MENGMENNQLTDKQSYINKLAQAAESTFWGYLGAQLESTDDDQVRISLEVKSHHMNLIGMVHGGVLSSLLDNAMGIAAMRARPEEKTVTTNLNVHFVAPMREGKLYVTAHVVHQSNKSLTIYGEVTDDQGMLGTMGTGSFRVI